MSILLILASVLSEKNKKRIIFKLLFGVCIICLLPVLILKIPGFDTQQILFLVFFGLTFLFLIYLSLEDISGYEISFKVILVSLAVGVIFNFALYFGYKNFSIFEGYIFSPEKNLIGALLSFLGSFILVKITREKYFGEGDVYLFAITGLLVGIDKLIVTFYITIITGAAGGIVILLLRKSLKNRYIPLVPFISFAAVFTIVFWDKIAQLLSELFLI